MELRHLRYFVAVAEEGSFTRAARRLFVAQPALSRQIRDLETEVGVPLLLRHSRGVRTTTAGEAFLVEARRTLERAVQAVGSARDAAEREGAQLRFAHGELYAFSAPVEELLAGFGAAHPDVQVRVSGQSDQRTYDALLEGRVDVGCVFLGRWPIPRFQGFPLVDASATGVLLPARHPLASRPSVRLADLASLPWLGIMASRWPGFREDIVEALEARGLPVEFEPPEASGSPFVRIAAGEAWALANLRMAAVHERHSAVAYRPITDAPIPIWLAVVWLAHALAHADRLVEVARGLGLGARDPAGEPIASD